MQSNASKSMPRQINVIGIEYQIEYCDNPADVDDRKRAALWGEVDFWTRTIRVYSGEKRGAIDMWQTLMHELIHIIDTQLHLELFDEKDDKMDSLALGLLDTLMRNGWLRLGEQEAINT